MRIFVARGEARLVARVAQQRRLTSYDAAYVAVAITNDLPLASLDKELQAAAKAEGVTLLPKTISAQSALSLTVCSGQTDHFLRR